MAITSEIIGKLGGRVESVPVSMSGNGGSSNSSYKHLLTRVEVPAGKQVLVAVVGTFTTTQASTSRPDFEIGEFVSPASSTTGAHASASAVLTQSGDVNVITKSTVGTSTFVGTVYTAEM